MSGGEIVGLVFAAGFLALVGFIGYPLVKLGKVLDETRVAVRGISDGTVPLLTEVTTTVASTNEQLVKVDSITSNVAQVSTNVSALTSLFAATLGSPVVKVAAFSYGVRRAMSGRGASSGSRRGRR
jgi:uncharacterized protein YoxC